LGERATGAFRVGEPQGAPHGKSGNAGLFRTVASRHVARDQNFAARNANIGGRSCKDRNVLNRDTAH
jgi:hypothetical protein